MKIKDVLERYHKMVPFPISSTKIKAAGFNVTQYITDMIAELRKCEDSENFLSQNLRSMVLPSTIN